MSLIRFAEFLQLYDPRLVADPPGHDLFRMFPVICLDDRPAAMRTVVAAPLKVVQVARGVDFPDDRITVTSVM